MYFNQFQSSKLPLLIPHTNKSIPQHVATDVGSDKSVFTKDIVSNVSKKRRSNQLFEIQELPKRQIQQKTVSDNEVRVKLEPLDIPLNSKDFPDHSECRLEKKIHQDATVIFESFLAAPKNTDSEDYDIEVLPKLGKKFQQIIKLTRKRRI